MSWFIVSGLFSFFTNLAIGLFVFSRNPTRTTNKLFALFSLTVSGWSVGSFFENAVRNEEIALWILRFDYIFGVLLPAVYVHFIYQIVGAVERKKRLVRGLYVVSILLIPWVFSPWFIPRLQLLQPSGFRISTAGPIYYLFFAVFCYSIWIVLSTLIEGLVKSSGQRKIEFKYLLIANAVAILAGFEYFSKVFKLFSSPPIDDYLLVIYFGILAYAILRHQILEIRLAVTIAGLSLGTYLVILGFPFLLGWKCELWLQKIAGSNWWLIPLGLSTALAAVGPFVYAYLRRRAEERLLREQREYQRTLQRAARGMTRVKSAKRLAQLIARIVSRSIKVTHASLFLLDSNQQRYLIYASYGPKRLALQSRYSIELTHPVIQWLIKQGRILTNEEAGNQGNQEIVHEMENLNAALVIPGLIERKLIGFLILGQKTSGIEYSSDDLHAFTTLANEAAIALENASSYEELLKVNEQLRAASQRLAFQERLAAAGQFATGMAHEIKNPLAAIKTFAQYLPERYNDSGFREKFFRIVQSEIDRINTIVKELSDFAKPAPLQLQPLHLVDIIKDTVTLLSNQCLKQSVEVTTAVQENGVLVRADPGQIKQVVLNVLLNSLEAMSGGGRLEITTKLAGQYQVLRISDTGCGIAPENQRQIWDPFFTTKERGMGLGLSIVKGVIERHGGQVTIISAAGKGTTVELSLPILSF